MPDFRIVGSARLNDDGLGEHIRTWAAAIGRPVKDVAMQYGLKPLVKFALDLIPPASANAKGQAAKRAGEAAIMRDLSRAGFTPVDIKGYRMLDHVFGHKLDTPIRIPTKLNPKFADAEAIRTARMKNRHGGKVTRGGKQAWYVDRRQFAPMKKRLIGEVGRLASAFAAAAKQLDLTVPAWIARHASLGRGTTVQIIETKSSVSLRVVGHFPSGTEDTADDVERRIGIYRGYVRDGLARQIKAKLAGAWGNRR